MHETSPPALLPAPAADVNDGEWHMITVSTFPNNTEGIAMYLDGEEVGALRPGLQAANGSQIVPPGGDPAYMTDNIYLCSRSDLDEERWARAALCSCFPWEKKAGLGSEVDPASMTPTQTS